jgi:hypothetical protein
MKIVTEEFEELVKAVMISEGCKNSKVFGCWIVTNRIESCTDSAPYSHLECYEKNGGKILRVSTILLPISSISTVTSAIYPCKIKYFKENPEIFESMGRRIISRSTNSA